MKKFVQLLFPIVISSQLFDIAGIAVVDGSAFGLPGFFRISYATSMENLQKALAKIQEFCENLN